MKGTAMSTGEDRYSEIEVETLDEAGVQELIANALALADCSWEELQEQAKVGRFANETAREVWFVVSTFAEPATA